MLMTVCAMLIMLLIIFMHRENIKRLLNGKENKFTLKKSRAGGPSASESDSGKKTRSLHRIDEDTQDDADGKKG